MWWTAYPARVPLAVAWSGGPPAAALGGLEQSEILDIALDGLAGGLRTTRRRIAARVRRAFVHDWENDPFSRGAYSYAGVGGAEAAQALTRPVARTLCFAGEATDRQRSGTVEGAISSGLRAARQVDAALREE